MVSDLEIWIASICLFIGLFHGTYDWLLLDKYWKDRDPLFHFISVTVLYIVVGVPYIILWFIYPGVSMIIFLVLTALHWGQEELYSSKFILGESNLDQWWRKALLVLSKGGMTVVFPLIYYQGDYRLVVNTILSLFNSEGSIDWIFNGYVIVYLVFLVFGITLTHILTSSSRIEKIECSAMSLWFIILPVSISIPGYLAFKHTPIHMTRYYRLEPMPVLDVLLDSIPYGVGALLIYGAGLVFIPNAMSSLLNMASLYLVLLAVLTLPHTVVTLCLDFEQGVF